MDNAELKARLDAVIETLQNIETALTILAERRLDEQDRIELAQERVRQLTGRASIGWPWTAETATQGFLAGRWLRRDGDVYGAGALRGAAGSIAPPRGGDDNQAKVDVPSGAPRV